MRRPPPRTYIHAIDMHIGAVLRTYVGVHRILCSYVGIDVDATISCLDGHNELVLMAYDTAFEHHHWHIRR